MNLKLELEFSKADILKDVDALKRQIDAMRPLPEDVEGRVMQKLRLDWNYHSNAIEGNRLNYGETVAFLMEGITAKGKPLKDHLDIRGHNEAINFLLEIVKETRPISEADIRALHEMVLVEPYDSPATTPDGLPTVKRITLGEYKSSLNHVKTATGEIHYYATPEETPAKMQELMEWHGEAVDNGIHPVVIAALFHHKFVEIHPFDDGNGRLSRILMNLILMQNSYPPVIVKIDDRTNYYSLLSRADNNDSWPFVVYITERLKSSLQLYIKAANNGDIDDDDDIDKEIALFRIELQNRLVPPQKGNRDDIYAIILNVIFPFFVKLNNKMDMFNEFFERVVFWIEIIPKTNEKDDFSFRNIDNQAKAFNYVEQLKSVHKNVEEVTLQVNLVNFKNPNNVFTVTDELFVKFHDKEYSISDVGLELNLYKFYQEVLSIKEQNFIINNMIKNLKYLIDSNFS